MSGKLKAEEILRVLVVDDEKLSRETALHQLNGAGFPTSSAENGYRGLEALAEGSYDVVVCDLRMPGMDGLEFLRHVQKGHPDVDVVIMTAYGTVKTAVEALQLGATDYLTKPFRFHDLHHRLKKLAELRGYRREIGNLRLQLNKSRQETGIIARSPQMLKVLQRIRSFAHDHSPVLVTGETGTGKELVSRALHQLGPRAEKPFVAVACGAIPSSLAESEMFGHEKGAFTGATRRRKGAFEQADGGTLLLDDVDDLPQDLQVKLLRALQEGTFHRVGGSREIHVDVRVIATSKIDLSKEIGESRFRDDLFFRLRGLEIFLPPLRERLDDLVPIAQAQLNRLAQDSGRSALTLSPEVIALLRRYPWPGNVRSLVRVIESASAVCDGGTILPRHLPEYITSSTGSTTENLFSLHLDACEKVSFKDLVSAFESSLVSWALRKAGGQQTHAAEILGLARTTFQSKLIHLASED